MTVKDPGPRKPFSLACVVIPGSLWDPHVAADVSVDMEHKKFSIAVCFETSPYSERYEVSIQSRGFQSSKNVSLVTESYD